MRSTYLIKDFCCLARARKSRASSMIKSDDKVRARWCQPPILYIFQCPCPHVRWLAILSLPRVSQITTFCRDKNLQHPCTEQSRMSNSYLYQYTQVGMCSCVEVKAQACWGGKYSKDLKNNIIAQVVRVLLIWGWSGCLQFAGKCQDKWHPEPGARAQVNSVRLWADPRPRVISASASKPQHSLAEIFISITLCK